MNAKRIILVEDDSSIQDTVMLILESSGYHVDIYSSGEPILKNEYQIPDLFIVDKQLTGVDGLDVCRHLKSNEATKKIPVIMLSASPSIIPLAKAAGADSAIEKPFRMQELKETVEVSLGLVS